MRFGYRFRSRQQPPRSRSSADVFNLTNHTNFANPGGNQNAPRTFLLLTAYSTSYTPRKLQIGARIRVLSESRSDGRRCTADQRARARDGALVLQRDRRTRPGSRSPNASELRRSSADPELRRGPCLRLLYTL